MFAVEIKNEAVTAALTRLSALTGDMAPIMKQIGELLAQSTQDRLKAGISPDGTAFAPRSPVTIANYARKKVSFGGVLYRGGDLYNQIASESGSDYVEVGSNMAYAAMMHFGGTKAAFPNLWGNIPARPFLGISQDDERDILAEIAEALSEAVQP